jgi:hypothetical protein
MDSLTFRARLSETLSCRKEDFLTQEALSLYRHLRGLRNHVAHAGDLTPTPEAALNVIELGSRLKRALTR